jgi:hypothetical protein
MQFMGAIGAHKLHEKIFPPTGGVLSRSDADQPAVQ